MGGIFEPIWTMIVVLNSTLVTSMGSYDAAVATGSMGVFGKPFFDSFMYVGGSGATLGLLIATFIFSKRRDLKEIAKYATPPGIFQINEPTIFGYPIILNPVYFAPFILAPIANLMTAYIFSPAVLN
jgi:PTS system cellobiose-specific IIC component